MRLSELKFIKLLPQFMREDDANQGLAAAVDGLARDLDARAQKNKTWDQLDNMNGQELDALADELNIRWYDTAVDIETKRRLIRESDLVHMRLGTPWAVEEVITAYFGSGVVREWWEYGGEPFHFKVLSDNPSLTNENYDIFLHVLEIVKRKSAVLESILITLTGESYAYYGMGMREHNREVHSMGLEALSEI